MLILAARDGEQRTADPSDMIDRSQRRTRNAESRLDLHQQQLTQRRREKAQPHPHAVGHGLVDGRIHALDDDRVHIERRGKQDGRAAERDAQRGDRLSALNAEKKYRAAMKHWDSYQTWKTHRNPARAELERQHGYDTKHAMHLIRLMRMGLEVLETGDLCP